jgi:hypothetical protein
MMRWFSILLLTIAAGIAFAATPEDDYFAMRDQAIAEIAAMEKVNMQDPRIGERNQAALAELQRRLVEMLGSVPVAGFSAKGTISLDTLDRGDMGFGMLDGLRYQDESGNGPNLLVSTRGLTERFLRDSSANPEASARLPARVDKALALDKFYEQALGSDVRFVKTLDLALQKPVGADLALARLGGWTQDEGPIYKQRVLVAVLKGKRLLIADAPATPAVPKIAACETLWTQAEAAAQTARNKAMQRAGPSKAPADFSAAYALSRKGEADHLACMRQRLRGEPAFAALHAQAQALAERMAAGRATEQK